MDRASILAPPAPMNEINLTPFIDLSFLLLITFIITFPLVEQGIPVNLPVAGAIDLPHDRSKTVTVDADGRVFLDERMMSAAELTAALQTARRANPEVTIFVRADEAIRYGKVVGVLKILHDAKIARMALVTQGEEVRR